MNIEKIKWMIEKADGFEWEKTIYSDSKNLTAKVRYNHNGIQPVSDWVMITIIHSWILWPLLLQRTIEGINREYVPNGIFNINQDWHCISVSSGIGLNFFTKNLKIITKDQAKQDAIDYVYEQGTK